VSKGVKDGNQKQTDGSINQLMDKLIDGLID
jgi:hypothetical protein